MKFWRKKNKKVEREFMKFGTVLESSYVKRSITADYSETMRITLYYKDGNKFAMEVSCHIIVIPEGTRCCNHTLCIYNSTKEIRILDSIGIASSFVKATHQLNRSLLPGDAHSHLISYDIPESFWSGSDLF